MKNLIMVLSVTILFTSCATMGDTAKLTQQLELGMTKTQVVAIMGKNYYIESLQETDEGRSEVLHFHSTYSVDYLMYFLNDKLVEFHRYIPPTYPQQGGTVTNGNTGTLSKDTDSRMDDAALAGSLRTHSGEKGVEEKVSKDIFGNTVIEDNSGNKKTIGKDIFGNTVIEDNKGNKTTVKTDISGNKVIEDNKGNKKTISKDIFGNTVIEDNKGNKTTVKTDIFGNKVIEDNKGNKLTVKKDIHGDISIEDY